MRKFILIVLLGLFFYPLVKSILLVVDQREYAVVFASGEIRQIISEPGLYYKKPVPIEDDIKLDKRVLTTEMITSEKMVDADKKFILVDAFVKWRIVDPKAFYVTFLGEMQSAHDRMLEMLKSALNEEFKRYKLKKLVAGDRSKLLLAVQKSMAKETKNLGVVITDVSLKRVNYGDSEAVFDQMKVKRTQIANELRANGVADAEKIRASADKQHTVIIAEASRKAQKIRGDADAQASRLYAWAFSKDPEFAKFYRTLEAYRATFNSRNDVIVVDPSSEFFRYMKNPKATGAK